LSESIFEATGNAVVAAGVPPVSAVARFAM
jgi:hypothetical protein